MPIKPKKLEKILVNKFRFSLAEGHSSDHRWYELELPGLPKILTRVSHSRKEIGKKLESIIAKQLRVRNAYYNEMVSCTKGLKEYYHQVKDDPYPPFEDYL
jgi:hypothetical protein